MATSTMASKLKPRTGRSSAAPRPPVDGTSNDGALPLDLLYDILLRLPAKSLCRFRAVCASWCSLLCHPDFIAAADPGPPLAVGFCHDAPDHVVSVLDMESGDVIKRITVDCEGHYVSPPPHQTHGVSPDRAVCAVGRDGRLRLIDPATDAVSLLPDPPRSDYMSTSCTLGRAAFTGEYKVLALANKSEHEQQICMILTLDANGRGQRWRETGSPLHKAVLPMPPWSYSMEVAVIEGVAYFLVYTNCRYAAPDLDRGQDWIMGFDLEGEEWWPNVIQCPVGCRNATLASLDGCLVVCDHQDRKFVQLWFLADAHLAIWSKLYTIVMPFHRPRPPLQHEYFGKPLAVLDDGRIVVWMRVASPGSTGAPDAVLRFYDPRTGAFTDGTLVADCSHVRMYMWSMLYSGNRNP